MLGSLIATLLICIGVANTTPICNYAEKETAHTIQPKKASAVNNYELTLQRSNFTQQIADYGTYKINTNKYSLNGGNAAINVIGTYYMTENYNEEGGTLNYGVSNNTSKKYGSTDFGIMLKITPYQVNIDTETTCTLRIKLETNAVSIGYDKVVYQSTDSNMDQFINMQLASEQSKNIAREIENVNNGFYYEKTISTTILASDWIDEQASYNGTVADTIEITIVQNTSNYYYIEYSPYIADLNTQDDIVYVADSIITITTMKINGTHIVPTGSYEVINIPGLMFEILGMPFAFVSQAFNLTLFPGTPYQINIANLFLSIMAIFVFVWVISIFIKIKSSS